MKKTAYLYVYDSSMSESFTDALHSKLVGTIKSLISDSSNFGTYVAFILMINFSFFINSREQR